jgi:signal transduction histidine kinase
MRLTRAFENQLSQPEQAGQMDEIAHKNSQRLGFLINDLLDMEKRMAGKLHFDVQAQPLMPLIEHALRDSQAYVDRHGVRLHLAQGAGDVSLREFPGPAATREHFAEPGV